MLYRNIHRIGLTILLIGILNLYNIIKYGLIFNIPGSAWSEELDFEKGLIKIDINIIKILLIVISLIYIIFNIINSNIIYKVEYELLIGLGLLGLIFLIKSNELIIFFINLELYSFSIYFLILTKETISIRRIAIFYFIISSLSSALLLFSFFKLYAQCGTLNIEDLFYLFNFEVFELSYQPIFLILLVFLFKLGTGPFIFWLVRVYSDIEKKILWYQLLIPKLIFFIFFIKFTYFLSPIFLPQFAYLLFFFAIISIIIGSIGGLFQKKDNIILSYSSILNMGYILLTFSIILINYIPSTTNIIENYETDKMWLIYQYFIIYFINLLGLFSILFLFKRTTNISLFQSFFLQPFFFISFLLLIFSFIGLPPLSGFFSKFYLFFSYFSFSTLSITTLSIFICSTLISSFFYFKFLFSSSITLNFLNSSNNTFFSTILTSTIPNFYTYLLSFSTLFTLFYYFFLSTIYPLYIISIL